MTQEELNALVNEFYEYLANQKDFYEVWPSDDDTICVDIDWGDWKHDHLRLNHTAEEFFNKKGYDILNMNTEVTDEDGSDTYSATHSYRIRKHVEESQECANTNDVEVEKRQLKESSVNKGEQIAKVLAKALKGECGPFGGENPILKDNKLGLYSQMPTEWFIFNEDGSVDFDNLEEIIEEEPDEWGVEDEEDKAAIISENKHFASVKDLFNSGLSWFMEVSNEEELLKNIDKILSESSSESSVESKVRLENPKFASWADYYLNDICNGDEDQYNELYADSVENDFGDEPCQAFFDVLDDKDNYLGKIGVYLFDGMGMWYEIGFKPNEEYLDVDKLELEDIDLDVDGWFPKDATVHSDEDLLKTEEQFREFLKPYTSKIENAIEYSIGDDDLED